MDVKQQEVNVVQVRPDSRTLPKRAEPQDDEGRGLTVAAAKHKPESARDKGTWVAALSTMNVGADAHVPDLPPPSKRMVDSFNNVHGGGGM